MLNWGFNLLDILNLIIYIFVSKTLYQSIYKKITAEKNERGEVWETAIGSCLSEHEQCHDDENSSLILGACQSPQLGIHFKNTDRWTFQAYLREEKNQNRV